MKRLLFLVLSLLLVSACESGHDRYLKAEAQRRAAQEEQDRAAAASRQSALRALEIKKQEELDAVEHHRTLDATTHSCRKAVAHDPGVPVSVDTSGCTPEKLRAEEQAERDKKFDEMEKDQYVDYSSEPN